jgi:hypothetical protein
LFHITGEEEEESFDFVFLFFLNDFGNKIIIITRQFEDDF